MDTYPKRTKRELWKAAYDRLQTKCAPLWEKYDKLRKSFYDNFNPRKGDFSTQHEKALGELFDRFQKDKEPFILEYMKECKKIGVNLDTINVKEWSKLELGKNKK